jgi:protein-tyrosine phosphatase
MMKKHGEIRMTNHFRRFFVSAWLGVLFLPAGIYAQTAATTDLPAKRVIPLAGQSNFRDLGGYETTDGRHVKWGMIFRSGELSRLTADDYHRVSTLGIRTVYDLRDQSERASQPTAWDAGPVQSFASSKSESITGAMGPLSAPDVDAARARAALVDFYGQMPILYAPEYRVIFRELAAGHEPLLLHCTAGKDRTGLGSALILSALGVPRATVVQDFQLTNQLLKPSMSPPKTEFMRRFQQFPPDVKQAMMSADPAYIEAAFGAIESRYGSVNKYFSSELGVGPEQIKRLRTLYLE